jgi:hypothetical protein
MRFIKCDNLKEAIQRFHQAETLQRDPGERNIAFRELLGRFVDVCNAVAYAHSRGPFLRRKDAKGTKLAESDDIEPGMIPNSRITAAEEFGA